MNYFELFAFDTQFELDKGVLSERYRQLQRQFHPDKFANSSEREKLTAVQKTAEINDAYETLKDPVLRGEYMLLLRGLDLKHEQTTLQDTAFLMEQMELREELEDISSAVDVEEAIESFDDRIGAQTKDYQNQLAELLEVKTPEADLNAGNVIRKLKFMVKLHQELMLLEESLLD